MIKCDFSIWKISKKAVQCAVVLVILVTISVMYAYKTGLLFCGYYFADDHEIARLYGGIERDGLFATMQVWIAADTNLRFRPAYWVFRILESYLCGTRMVLWHLIKSCEIGLCAWLGFVFARKMKLSYTMSFLFGVIGFFGPQCAVVYRLGPQEPQALIWLFLGLICAVNYVEKNKCRWLIGFHIFITLMMLTKESFLILVPICVFFLLYLELKNVYTDDVKILSAIGKVIKKHWITISYEAIVCIACLCIIVFHSGVSSTGYAGLDVSYTIRDYLVAMWKIWTGELQPYLLLMLLAMVANVVLCMKNRKEKGYVFYRVCEAFMVLYFVLSQSFLHAKSGMFDRYLFPCITGILIYVCCFSIPLWKGKIQQWVPQIVFSVWAVWMVVASQFHTSCLNYVFTCSYNTQMLIRLSQLAEERGGEDCKIIVSAPFGEWNLAVCAFMEELYGVDQTYGLNQTDPDANEAIDRYVINHTEPGMLPIAEADIYVAQKEFLPIKMRENGVEYTGMQSEIFGNYMIFYY